MSNLDKIAQLRAEADKLEAAENAFQALPEEYKLAITLHEMTCRWNHADGCGWFYEIKDGIHDWNGQSHEPYLRKALMVKGFCRSHTMDINAAIELIKMVKE